MFQQFFSLSNCNMISQLQKPIYRSKLRRILGREFYILKRKIKWLFSNQKFSKVNKSISYDNVLIHHKSTLLRKLKDVEMYLQYNKITNLKLAVDKIDGVVIYPGETFSVWKMVGRPTKSKGYKSGMMIHNGKVTEGIGGGLCQLGNLIYWMSLHSPLTVTERWRHSFDVFPDVNRVVPFACGATLSYNYIDLQLKNNTDKIFQILLWLDDNYLHGEIRCNQQIDYKYQIIETEQRFDPQWWGGFTRHNCIWRIVTDLKDNSQTKEFVAENNAIMMYNPVLEY